MDNSDMQGALWGLLALIVPVACVLGHWPRVYGSYLEEDRPLRLRHLGFVVWGGSALASGEERYVGVALWGHLVLRRHDYGEQLLCGRGFNTQQARLMEGACTGVLRLRRTDGAALTGSFYGRRFSQKGGRMVPVETLAAVPRIWRRSS